jgi:hypothetical protein
MSSFRAFSGWLYSLKTLCLFVRSHDPHASDVPLSVIMLQSDFTLTVQVENALSPCLIA